MYHLSTARSDAQRVEMQRLTSLGECVFCPPIAQPVLHRVGWWSVTLNRFPYSEAAVHVLLVPTEHVLTLDALSVPAQSEMWAALRWTVRHFELSSYVLKARCGDPRATGGSVEHLHVHVIAGPAPTPNDGEAHP